MVAGYIIVRPRAQGRVWPEDWGPGAKNGLIGPARGRPYVAFRLVPLNTRKQMTQDRGSSSESTGEADISVVDAPEHVTDGLTQEDLVEWYTKMVLVRTIDERIWALNRQGKVPIAASCQGHEAAQLGSLLAAQRDGNCFIFPYYRDLGLKMAAGLTPTQVMLSFMGKEGEPYSNGRQFPLQGADLPRNIIQISNVVGAGLTQAVGYALGSKMKGDGTVVLCYFGDGASSQGEAHEAMNFAGVHKLPVVFICENNHYAISVPQHRQMATEDLSARAAGYGFPGLLWTAWTLPGATRPPAKPSTARDGKARCCWRCGWNG